MPLITFAEGHPGAIDVALVELGVRVVEQLSKDGWNHRVIGDYSVATLTRATQNDVMTVLRVHGPELRWAGQDWPVKVRTWFGVGYEPALNLMPVLTVYPRAALITDPHHGYQRSFIVDLTGPGAVAGAARRIVGFVDTHASSLYVNQFQDAAAIEGDFRRKIEQLRARVEAAGRGSDEIHLTAQRQLIVLAAMGRLDEVRALLSAYPAHRDNGQISLRDRRFVRQLTRWLDAGGPVAPPTQQTLAQLPQHLPPSSSIRFRAESRRKEALAAARAQAKGKTFAELKELIAAQNSARGIELGPSVLDFHAEILRTGQGPLGGARAALKKIRLLASVAPDLVRLMRGTSDDDPEWLRRPDRATYPMIADRNRSTSVQLDAASSDWLERVRAEAPGRTGPFTMVEVWLARDDPAGPIVASIGSQRVGTIRESDVDQFERVLRAAAFFDEDPFVEGQLVAARGANTALLEIPLPVRTDVNGFA